MAKGKSCGVRRPPVVVGWGGQKANALFLSHNSREYKPGEVGEQGRAPNESGNPHSRNLPH